ncbi:MAG: RNA methyltransferase, partial [Nanoarchaeota archaeon]
MKQIFIIEHLEPKLWEWCIIEYKNISRIIGKRNLWFTNIKEKRKVLEKYGNVIEKSVKDLNLKNACLLDPRAKEQLNFKEAKKFDYFIFGGILGNNPPEKRTSKELSNYINWAKKRNLGKAQLSTDSAVFVVKQILEGKKLIEVKFQDSAEIKINEVES